MDLETARSKSARAERQTILHTALLERRAELRQGWRRSITAECLENLDSAAESVKSLLSAQDVFHDWTLAGSHHWMDCQAGLAECLLSIGTGQPTRCWAAVVVPTHVSFVAFKKLSSKDRVATLSLRYRCPLNIGGEGESEIAEELLRQLMVTDRVKLKTGAEFDVDDILLKLNLVAVAAPFKRDLRFLDALNCFYELPPRSLSRLRRNPRLLAAWLCLYAQLLCAPGW